ncbi:MAG: DUF1836 domain-containing protein [Roseburia sp.]|nr:DUF1836 domain-containing protein [Anaeroplasma bactoclasticum]MCM1195858.1 DUF1836 domain-containing protein [Roseburia sp.]MCM1556554.1 DUF1836 domain-containing protein [Anaeroplasma bactoclasticum]
MNSINDILGKWLDDLNQFSYKDYKDLPDIDLYMDQVVTFLDKQLAIFQTSSLDKQITSSMINNYVKGEVVSAPISKKYNREHLALIQEVCTLKQVLTIAEVKQIIDERYRKEDLPKDEIFDHFKSLVNDKNKEAIEATRTLLNQIEQNDLRALTDLSVDLALTASAYISISKRILFLNRLYQQDLENKKKDKNEE